MSVLTGKVALITGGGSGIGRGIAEALAAAGAKVALAGRRPGAVEEAAEAIEEAGGEAIALSADVAQEDDARELVEAVVEAYGDLHVLVNNAGIARGGPLADMSSDDIDAVIDIDLKGPIWMIRAALPHLSRHQEADGAAVINISSSVTLNVVPNFSVYSAAKAGIDVLTRCLARDLAPQKIRVNAINPGVVATPIFETMMPKNVVDRALSSFAKGTPLGRVGQPRDIAELAVYLASPAAEWMTGAIIPLDGGISLAS